MRTALRLAALVLATSLATTAFAREVDESYGSTSLSAVPMHTTSGSDRAVHGKKEPNVPAKYDVSYPVRDAGRLRQRERGAI